MTIKNNDSGDLAYLKQINDALLGLVTASSSHVLNCTSSRHVHASEDVLAALQRQQESFTKLKSLVTSRLETIAAHHGFPPEHWRLRFLEEIDRMYAGTPNEFASKMAERGQSLGRLYTLVENEGASLTPPKQESTALMDPKEYLVNWREILNCLKQKNNDESKRRVADMNRRFAGPIVLPGQGGQPKVDKAKLLEWWNELEIQWITQGSGENATATVSEQYQHGKKGESVIPDIAGHVQKRRKKQP